MPIRPSEKARYPKNWKAISLEIRERAGWRCECMGECGLHRSKGPLRCRELHGKKARWAKGKVILTVAHLHKNRNPKNVRRKNLKAMCQRCHLRYDRFQHAANARKTREARSPQLRLGL